MGNLYRFVEPVVLLLLKRKGRSYGYDLSGDLEEYALTDAEIERAALYRTLRQHLQEWATVLNHVSKSMARFVKETRALDSAKTDSAR